MSAVMAPTFMTVEQERLHLDFFYSLVDNFENTTRYVTLADDNQSTYSIEFLRLLLDTCSEIDDLAKLYCEGKSPGSLGKQPTINEWRSVILQVNSHFPRTRISVAGRKAIVPWEPWGRTPEPENPAFWKAYNNVKHNRSDHFRDANLENVVNALCGLTALCISAIPNSITTWRRSYFMLNGLA